MLYLNYALRFLLELCGIVALWYVGWQASDELLLRLAAAFGAAGILVVLWALIVAPKARNAIPPTARTLIGTVLLLACAGALAFAGHGGLAAAFAAVNIVNTLVLVVAGGPEEAPDADRAPDQSRRS